MFKRARFDAHYREHYPRVRGLCRYLLGPDEDPEDAAQEVFERGLKAFSRFRSADAFAPWINTIARNFCIDRIRERQRTAAVFTADESAEPDALEDPADCPAGQLISAHSAAAVTTAVQQLPDRYRVPLVLAYYSDASYAEIAEQLEIAPGHVGVLLLRARQRLRQALNQQEAPQ
ncbi:MAG: sigma-70 family RNA polymerase sigma factor [Pseudomonadota bacterium]